MTAVTTTGILLVISIFVLSIDLWFFNWVNFSELPVGELSRGLIIIATVSKAKSCFVEPLDKVQVTDGQMGWKDQKAGNLPVK